MHDACMNVYGITFPRRKTLHAFENAMQMMHDSNVAWRDNGGALNCRRSPGESMELCGEDKMGDQGSQTVSWPRWIRNLLETIKFGCELWLGNKSCLKI